MVKMIAAVVAVLGAGAGPAAADVAAPADAGVVVEQLVARYRGLVLYEDVADVVERIETPGAPPHTVETRIACAVHDGALEVTTPGDQVRRGTGLDTPVRRSPAMASLVLRYNLWLAPHLALRFAEDPLADFRVGVPEGFEPAGAQRVDVEGRVMLRLELVSRAAGESEAGDRARFVLLADAGTMLVERVEGRQRLADGTVYRVELAIEPQRVRPRSPQVTDSVG